MRKLQISFGGVLIFGTMDHTQIQPINQLPFLTSSLTLTIFQAVQLQHYVRSHGDIEFQRLHAIARINPFDLVNDLETKNDFFELSSQI